MVQQETIFQCCSVICDLLIGDAALIMHCYHNHRHISDYFHQTTYVAMLFEGKMPISNMKSFEGTEPSQQWRQL